MFKHLKNKPNNFLSNFLLSILIISAVFAYVINTDLEYFDDNVKGEVRQTYSELEWDFIESMIYENIEKSKNNTNSSKKYIKDMIDSEYTNMTLLKQDIDSHMNENIIYHILRNSIEGKFINEYNSDNDMFIAMADMIISDFDKESDAQSTYRTWTTEIKKHYNPVIAEQAVYDILKTNKEYTIWQRDSPLIDIEDVDSVDINVLKDIYLTYGIDGLNSYSVLVISRLDDTKDIFDVHDVNNIGELQDNYKFFIIQEFTIRDMYNTYTFKSFFSSIKFKMKTISMVFDNYIRIKSIWY